jgi:hypothetical protein
LQELYGHIQEVIIQNFRAKPDIPMQAHPEPTLLDFLRTIAVARLIFGGEMNLQAPPGHPARGRFFGVAAGLLARRSQLSPCLPNAMPHQ